ncbi:MAG: hypothetical protein ABJD11_17165 [Gemmatimonadota bacterium]
MERGPLIKVFPPPNLNLYLLFGAAWLYLAVEEIASPCFSIAPHYKTWPVLPYIVAQ